MIDKKADFKSKYYIQDENGITWGEIEPQVITTSCVDSELMITLEGRLKYDIETSKPSNEAIEFAYSTIDTMREIFFGEKGENEMEILKIWKERKLGKIDEETNHIAKLIKNEDKIEQEIEKFKDKILDKYNVELSIGMYDVVFLEETKEKLEELYKKSVLERKEIDLIYNEAKAQLEICETYEQKINVLVAYKIIDKETMQIIA